MYLLVSVAVAGLVVASCSPAIGPANWYLNPTHPEPTAESTEIHVWVREHACNSGELIGDRLIGPEVREARDEVVISFSAERPTGAQTCFGGVGDAVAVTLSAPLGDRRLVDGGTDPPIQVLPATSIPPPVSLP